MIVVAASIARVKCDAGKVEVDFIGRVLYSDVKDPKD